MSMTLGRALVRVKLDTAAMKRGFNDVRQTADKAYKDVEQSAAAAAREQARAAEHAKQVWRNTFGVVALAAASAARKMRTAMLGLADFGLDIAGRNEKYIETFKVLTGSAEEGLSTFNRIKRFSALTPFNLPDLAEAGLRLTSIGQRGEEVTKTMRMLGDAAQGDVQKFKTAIRVYSQTAERGILYERQVKQLLDRSILSYKDIADAMGVSVARSKEMQKEGKVGFDILQKAFEKVTAEGGRFHNMLERQSKLLVGLRSTYKDNLEILAGEIAKPTLEIETLILKLKIELVQALATIIKQTGPLAIGLLYGAAAGLALAVALGAALAALSILGIVGTAITGGLLVGLIAVGAAVGGFAAAWLSVKENMEWFKDYMSVFADQTMRVMQEMSLSIAMFFYTAMDQIKLTMTEGLMWILDTIRTMKAILFMDTSWEDLAYQAMETLKTNLELNMQLDRIELTRKIKEIFDNIRGKRSDDVAAPPPGPSGFDAMSGRFGFFQFGQSLQDALLRQDKQQEMINSINAGNAIQQNILQAVQQGNKNQPGLGGGGP